MAILLQLPRPVQVFVLKAFLVSCGLAAHWSGQTRLLCGNTLASSLCPGKSSLHSAHWGTVKASVLEAERGSGGLASGWLEHSMKKVSWRGGDQK